MTLDEALREQARISAELQQSFAGYSLRGAELLVWVQTYQDEETDEWHVMPCVGWRTHDHAWGNHIVVSEAPGDDAVRRPLLGILQASVDRHLN